MTNKTKSDKEHRLRTLFIAMKGKKDEICRVVQDPGNITIESDA